MRRLIEGFASRTYHIDGNLMPRIIYNLLLLQATLKANIAGHEVSTVVSTSDLSTTEGKILHRLTARAIISDWEDGVLSPDRTDHEVHSVL